MSYGESLLEEFLKAMVPAKYLRNHRPEWLYGLELDFFFPGPGIGIEFQGEHHYRPTDYAPNIHSVHRNDQLKRVWCRRCGVRLIRIDAVHLEYTRLRAKFKAARLGYTLGNSDHLRSLNKKASQYRQLLKRKFNCVTVHERRSKIRNAPNPHKTQVIDCTRTPQ